MLSLIIVFAIAVPLMIWALSPSPVRRRRASPGFHSPVDATSLPPAVAAGSLPFGSSCDAGGGGCDGG
jgi:hypothetical protein